MEDIVDMLKLLNYESLFCKQKYSFPSSNLFSRGFKPFSRSFFAVPSTNPSEQFMQFVQLVSWLLEVGGQKVSGWGKYDDPTTASQNMILELKKMGIELDMPASKLKTGNGEGVCTLI